MNICQYFDHTILKATTTSQQLKEVCDVAKQYGFASVAVNTGMVAQCAAFLAGSDVVVDAAVGFPLGITTVAGKLFEAEEAIRNGAGEVDYVVNIGKVKEGDWSYIRDEMAKMVALCRSRRVICKVIFENCYLTGDEKCNLCAIAKEVEPDFIKTSTGFGTGGATVADVKLMKQHVGDRVKVKASGGIRDLETFLEILDAGAERVGCSCSAAIADAYKNNKEE